MSSSGSDKDPLEIDLYGVRIKGTVKAGDYPDPETWRDVWRSVHGSLKSIVANVFGLLSDSLKGSRNVVRGVSALPASLASRVERAHVRADAMIARNTEFMAPNSKQEAIVAIQDLIHRKQLEGFAVRVYSENERLMLCFLPPMSESDAANVAASAAHTLPPVKGPEDRKTTP